MYGWYMNNATDRKTPYTTMSLTPAARRVVHRQVAKTAERLGRRATVSEVLHALCTLADDAAVAALVKENREGSAS